MTELVPRATVAQVVALREEALRKFSAAHSALEAAASAVDGAKAAVRGMALADRRYARSSTDEGKKLFLSGLSVPGGEDFMAAARQIVDRKAWQHIVTVADVEKLMDKTAREDFWKQLRDDPPEVTVENVFATLQGLAQDAGMIFRRGIAETFSGLDRRFKSHDGFKIGSRIILTRAFDERGFWNYYRNHRDTIFDVERTFRVLDGLESVSYSPLQITIDEARKGGWDPRQTEVETEYFLCRIFKNGNAHLWFKRDDLVRQVNQLLADYYGEVIGDARPDDDPLKDRKTTPARNHGFYPTPDALADLVIREASLFTPVSGGPLRVLEPSAGTGQLARRARKEGAEVDCIEIQADLAHGLRSFGFRTTCDDFLTLPQKPVYDRIVMNPPFDRERDIDHVTYALGFLKPGGSLIAIMSAGTEFRETRKSKAFRDLMQRMGAEWRDLPPRSFASLGTNINTILLKVTKA